MARTRHYDLIENIWKTSYRRMNEVGVLMAEEEVLESVFGRKTIASKAEAMDQLSAAAYVLRGVSDSLLALSEQPSDYQDAMRMLSDVVFHEAQTLKQVGELLG